MDVRLENCTYRFIVIDRNRPPEIKDLNLTEGMEIEGEELRKNLVTVKVYSLNPMEPSHIEVLDEFAKGITDHIALAHCHVIITFYEAPLEVALNKSLIAQIGKKESDIPIEKLWHLNQD